MKKKRVSDLSQGCQHFSTIKCTNKVYTIPCTHSYVKRWEFCTPCFEKKNFFENLFTIVPYYEPNGSPDSSSKGFQLILQKSTFAFKVLSNFKVSKFQMMNYLFCFEFFQNAQFD